jgi:hypothetical protein
MTEQSMLPDHMVEAAAKAEYAIDMTREESDDFELIAWAEALSFVAEAYRRRAAAGLAAAVAGCEVTETFRVRQDDPERLWSSRISDIDAARTVAAAWRRHNPGAVVVVERQLSITVSAVVEGETE